MQSHRGLHIAGNGRCTCTVGMHVGVLAARQTSGMLPSSCCACLLVGAQVPIGKLPTGWLRRGREARLALKWRRRQAMTLPKVATCSRVHTSGPALTYHAVKCIPPALHSHTMRRVHTSGPALIPCMSGMDCSAQMLLDGNTHETAYCLPSSSATFISQQCVLLQQSA